MPLVYRRSTHKTTTSMAIPTQEYAKYIHPSRMTAGEKLVPMKDISDRQMRELAALYPDEYGEECRARRLTPQYKEPRSNVNNNAAEIDESQPLERPLGAPHVRPNLQPQNPNRTRMPVPRGARIPEAGHDDPELEGLEFEDEPQGDIPEAGAVVTPQHEAVGELEAMFTSLSVADATDFIVQAAAQNRTKVLARLAEAEQNRPTPRKTVLKAFERVGVVVASGDSDETPAGGE